MKLSELKTGQAGIIVGIDGSGEFRRRITEMGFVRGKRVIVVKNAPLHDPIEYNILGCEVSLRRDEALRLEVEQVHEVEDFHRPHHERGVQGGEFSDVANLDTGFGSGHENENNVGGGRVIKVALIGNPNSGKTTLFNAISGHNEHTGNYSGVTVDAAGAVVEFDGYTIVLTDLPGTYSISPFSPEERFVRDYIAESHPDVVVNVIDGSNIERNLYLTTQLIDMGQRAVLAMNMYDEFLASGDRLDRHVMSELLGMPIVPTVGKRGRGVPHILQQIVKVYNEPRPLDPPKVNYSLEIERLIEVVQRKISAHNSEVGGMLSYTDRYVAIKLIEGQGDILPGGESAYPEVFAIVRKGVRAIEQTYAMDVETLMTDARYGFISGAMKESYVYANRSFHTRSTQIDRVLTHRYFGLPIFVFLLWVVFYSTFTLGQYPMEWITMGVEYVKQLVDGVMSSGPLRDLIVDGIIDGVGSVVVFLPNIMILFLFISFMEDTGYMARAAFITDKLMHKIGLHGKSFIPMIMGFGCGVPAIMATRTIENRHNRIQTMLLVPFMSCSARLPVYILIAGTFFPRSAGNVLFGMYFGGIVLAVLSSLLLKKVVFGGKDVNFVMELPPYRVPTFLSTVSHVWVKAKDYLSKMGGVILVAVIIIWALGYYPRQSVSSSSVSTSLSHNSDSVNVSATSNSETVVVEHDSYLSRIGKGIEPVIAPLGFDWKMGIGLLSGIAAKEVIVSSMSVIYHTPEDDQAALGPRLAQDVHSDGTAVWNGAVAISFLTFVLIYFPCVAAVSAIRRESGSIKWALFTVVYTTALAWIVSFIVYNVAKFFI